MKSMLIPIVVVAALIAVAGRPSTTTVTSWLDAPPPQEDRPCPLATTSTPAAPPPLAEAAPETDTGRPVSRPSPSSPGQLIQAFADGFHGLTATADRIAQDSVALSEDEERQQGDRLSRVILARERLWTSPQTLKRVQDLARPLLERKKRRGIEYTFTLLDNPEVNAFSIVGGHIFVNRGLIELAKRDVELQFVLGHEIAHVDLGHCARMVAYQTRAEEVGGAPADLLVGLAYSTVALGFSEDFELESDAWSYQSLISIGRTHEQSLAFFHTLAADAEAKQKAKSTDRPDRPRPEEDAGTLGRVLSDHFASHPPTARRIERLEALGRRNSSSPGAATPAGDVHPQ